MTPDILRAKSNAAGVVLAAAALLTVGLVMVASAGASLDRPVLELEFWRTPFGRQAIYACAGFAVLLIAARGTHRILRWREGSWFQPSLMLLLASLAFSAAVLVPGLGTERKGAQRWLQLGPTELGLIFQPSELAKVALVAALAAFLAAKWRGTLTFWRGLAPAAAMVGICAGLVAVEDFGTGALLACVGGAMLVVGGAKWRQLFILVLPALAAGAWLVISKPYRMARLTTFLDIWEDPRGAGYHPIQSLVTIASGGLSGRGLGAGVQKYGYLPEARNDFIFSVICEETGLIGAAVVIGLFVVLLWCGRRVMLSANDPFGRLLAFGMAFMVVIQAVINIAVVTVCAPTKGISLPLVSAGGSGVVFLCIALGLLASVANDARVRASDSPPWPEPA